LERSKEAEAPPKNPNRPRIRLSRLEKARAIAHPPNRYNRILDKNFSH